MSWKHMERPYSEYHKWIWEWDCILGSIQTCHLSWQNIIEIKKRSGNCTLRMFSRYSILQYFRLVNCSSHNLMDYDLINACFGCQFVKFNILAISEIGRLFKFLQIVLRLLSVQKSHMTWWVRKVQHVWNLVSICTTFWYITELLFIMTIISEILARREKLGRI